MKKILSIILLFIPAAVLAQQNFIIKGYVGKVNPSGKIYLTYRDYDTTKVDSSELHNGSFQFKGQVKEVTFAELVMNYKHTGLSRRYRTDGSNTYNFYLVSGTTLISSNDSLVNAKISGTKMNEDGILYDSLLTGLQTKKHLLIQQYLKSPKSKDDLNAILANMKVLQNEKDSLSFVFIKNHPDSYMSLIILGNVAGFSPDAIKVQPVYNLLSADLRNTTEGKRLGQLLKSVTSTGIGNTALDFTMSDTEGKKIKLSDFKGKYVLLDFWASWCAPCRQENPNLVKAYQLYKERNFTILSVSLDSKKDNWLKAIKDDHLTWAHVSDLKYWNNDAAVKYGINSVPSNFLIDPQGKIIAKNLAGVNLETRLKEILN